MTSPEYMCVVCGQQASQWSRKASWGPVTLYMHDACVQSYQEAVAPRLRDAVIRTVRRWKQRLAP